MLNTDVLSHGVRLVYMYVDTYPKRRVFMKTDLGTRPVYVEHKRIEIWSTSCVHVRRHISKETYLHEKRPGKETCLC